MLSRLILREGMEIFYKARKILCDHPNSRKSCLSLPTTVVRLLECPNS